MLQANQALILTLLLCSQLLVNSFRFASMSPKVTLTQLAAASGSSVDPSNISDFDRKVYEACARIPKGNIC